MTETEKIIGGPKQSPPPKEDHVFVSDRQLKLLEHMEAKMYGELTLEFSNGEPRVITKTEFTIKL